MPSNKPGNCLSFQTGLAAQVYLALPHQSVFVGDDGGVCLQVMNTAEIQANLTRHAALHQAAGH